MKNTILFIPVVIITLLAGCGSTPPKTATIPDESGDAAVKAAPQTKDDNASASDSNKKQDTSVDKVAEQADAYCKNEIKKGAQKPFDLLDKKQIKACIIAVRPKIKTQCDKGVKKEIILKIVVAKDGTVSGAFAIGDGADSDESQCVAEQIKSASFPAFSSKETQVIEKYPFTIGQ